MNKKAKWYRRIFSFFREVKAELKKVTWPSRNEVQSTTVVVILTTVFFGVYLYCMDLIFSWILNQVRGLFG
jgi:preprotein translocase subunit SecE